MVTEVPLCPSVGGVGYRYRVTSRELVRERAEVLVHEADGGCAVAYGRGDTFDRVLSHVARCEHTEHARLERQRFTVVIPLHFRLVENGPTRDEVTLFVAGDLTGEPLCVWFAPDHDEQRPGRDLLDDAARAISQREGLE